MPDESWFKPYFWYGPLIGMGTVSNAEQNVTSTVESAKAGAQRKSELDSLLWVVAEKVEPKRDIIICGYENGHEVSTEKTRSRIRLSGLPQEHAEWQKAIDEFQCPVCGRAAGQPCASLDSRTRDLVKPHLGRLDLADTSNAGSFAPRQGDLT